MSLTKRFKYLFTCSCGYRPTAADDAVVEPKPKPSFSDQKRGREARDCVSSSDDGCTSSTTFSAKFNDSLAVAKESDNPYRDFRQSMLEMIAEEEICSIRDLQQLLHCFLVLNPPQHHETILRAFMDIWNGDGEGRTPPCSA